MVTRECKEGTVYKEQKKCSHFFSHFVLQLQKKKKKTLNNKIYKEEAKL